MSTSPNRASNPTGKPRRKEVSFDLTTARQMLPLVRSIVSEIVNHQSALDRLAPEQERLDRHRRDLVWQERARRYAVSDEIATTEKALAGAVTELTGLGLSVVDVGDGEVAFPTRINGRPAAFTWRLGEEKVGFWHYNGEEARRPIPTDWESGTPLRFRNQP